MAALLRSLQMPSDIVAIVLAVVFFAALYLIIEAIDRV